MLDLSWAKEFNQYGAASKAIVNGGARMLEFLSIITLASCLSVATVSLPVSAEMLVLTPRGNPRQLDGTIFGASTSAFSERLLGDPTKIAALRTMAIGLDRFPGGSDANFYNWRTGLFEVPADENSSRYVQFWARTAAGIARRHPRGITLEQFNEFSRRIGAQVILVPNFETSSIDDQVQWFKRLASESAVPERIELGNEYYLGMGNDPASMARWPDQPTSMRIIKYYADALRPYFPPHVKLAVQSAAGAAQGRRGRFGQRVAQWDDNLRPEAWFDAVTVHLYPRLGEATGNPDATTTPPTPENAMPRLKAMMARVDEGMDQLLLGVERRVPGKEIWVTEWNPRGGTPFRQGDEVEPLSPAMRLLTTARMAMVFLRHPSVTAALFFMFSFLQNDGHGMFVSDGQGGYLPVPTAVALRWVNEATNAGGSFQRVVQRGAIPVAGGGARDESYLAVEGGLFQSGGRTTLILENASADQFSLDPATLVKHKRPSHVEFMSMPDLADTGRQPARIQTQNDGGVITVMPYSLTRVQW
jgi:hypothetical protein